MKSPVLRYLVYTVVIVIFMYGSFDVIFDLQRKLAEEYTGTITLYLVTLLIHLVFGLLLGADSFFREWAKAGRWKIQISKLLAFVLPFFVLTVIPLFTAVGGVVWPFAEALPYVANGTMGVFANIALGYGVLSCWYKE